MSLRGAAFETKLDPARLQPSADDWAFLKRWTRIEDDDELRALCIDIQKRAFAVHAFVCIAGFSFIDCKASKRLGYNEALALKNEPDAILVDFGAFTGTDARKAVEDGWPVDRVLGTELDQSFLDLGYELFRDSPGDPRTPKLLAGDIFDPSFLSFTGAKDESPRLRDLTTLTPLVGRVRALHAGALFHLFDEERQHRLATAFAALASRKPGTVIWGSHFCARDQPFPIEMKASETEIENRYAHSPQSFGRLWTDVFGTTSIKFDFHLQDRGDRAPSTHDWGSKTTNITFRVIVL